MTYLVRYTDLSGTKQPGQIRENERWEIIVDICQGSSLIDINKFLIKNGFPLINSLGNFRINGITLVYFISATEQIYIMDSDHKDCLPIIRDYKLKQIL
jgi:hypothetical protein